VIASACGRVARVVRSPASRATTSTAACDRDESDADDQTVDVEPRIRFGLGRDADREDGGASTAPTTAPAAPTTRDREADGSRREPRWRGRIPAR
jgi:hypothetical protein